MTFKLQLREDRPATTDEHRALREQIKRLQATLDFLLGDRSQLHPMFGGVPNVRDLCFNAFMRAKAKNDEDGGPTDWFNDTLPLIEHGITKIRLAHEQFQDGKK